MAHAGMMMGHQQAVGGRAALQSTLPSLGLAKLCARRHAVLTRRDGQPLTTVAVAATVASPPPPQTAGAPRLVGEAPTPPVLSNWNKSYFFTPAKYVEPTTVDEIQAVVRDTATYPSPVVALGSQHTVNQAMVNQAGTVVQLHSWSDIYGMEDRPDELVPGLGKKVVRVQPGVQLIDLAKWLDARGFECSFAPEIGNATAGSLASCTSKDSSLKAPGTFGSLVATVTYVSHTGELVTIDRGNDQDAMEEYNSSYSMKGIAVELTIVVRPRVLIKTLVTAYKTDDSLPSTLLRLKSEADNIWAIIDLDACTVEQRWQFASAQSWLRTPGFIVEAYRRYRYNLFLVGHNSPVSTVVPRVLPLTFIHHRWQLTNSYPEVSANQVRLDFSYFEYPNIEDFEHIVNTLVKWTREYKARTGFDGPGAFITYFVNRNGRKKWPLLNYGGDSGYSFICDPAYGRPTDPAWIDFCKAILPVARSLGARAGGSQTKQLLTDPDFFPLPKSFAPSDRFLTPYFANFLTDMEPSPPVDPPKVSGNGAR